MNTTLSYLECKRCSHRFSKKSDMLRHLDKKNLCVRNVESYKYNDEDLNNLSLIRIYTKNIKNTICSTCNKDFSCSSSLKRHSKKCSISSNLPISDTISENNNSNNNNSTVDSNIHSTVNSNNVNNVNISININNFDDNWNTDHIDDNLKLVLLLNKTKFTETLKNILKNEVNLNVMIDKTTDSGLVYNNNLLSSMDINDIVDQSMSKLYKHLCIFKDDLSHSSFNLDDTVLNDQIKSAGTKLKEYNKNKDIKGTVNKFISDIYCCKNQESSNVCSKNVTIPTDGF